MEFVKSPVTPMLQVAPHTSVRGLLEEYGGATEEVMLLAGETHLNRKPGSLRFTTRAALDEYMRLCLHDLRYIERLQIVAQRAAARMTERVEGRMWMAAQMRRGDCTPICTFIRPTLTVAQLQSLDGRWRRRSKDTSSASWIG